MPVMVKITTCYDLAPSPLEAEGHSTSRRTETRSETDFAAKAQIVTSCSYHQTFALECKTL